MASSATSCRRRYDRCGGAFTGCAGTACAGDDLRAHYPSGLVGKTQSQEEHANYSSPEAGIVKYRCDYCGGHLRLIVYRYYRMRFCCKAHMSAYKQRLTMETRAKIRHLQLRD
jgi:hypothetical protein